MINILLASYNDALVMHFTSVLKSFSEVTVLNLKTGKEVLSAVGKDSFQFMIADSNLPDTTGVKLIEQLAKAKTPINLVLISVLPTDGLNELTEGLGIVMQLSSLTDEVEMKALISKVEAIPKLVK